MIKLLWCGVESPHHAAMLYRNVERESEIVLAVVLVDEAHGSGCERIVGLNTERGVVEELDELLHCGHLVAINERVLVAFAGHRDVDVVSTTLSFLVEVAVEAVSATLELDAEMHCAVGDWRHDVVSEIDFLERRAVVGLATSYNGVVGVKESAFA